MVKKEKKSIHSIQREIPYQDSYSKQAKWKKKDRAQRVIQRSGLKLRPVGTPGSWRPALVPGLKGWFWTEKYPRELPQSIFITLTVLNQ